MSKEAAEAIGRGLAWMGFWLAVGAYWVAMAIIGGGKQ